MKQHFGQAAPTHPLNPIDYHASNILRTIALPCSGGPARHHRIGIDGQSILTKVRTLNLFSKEKKRNEYI